MRDVIGISVYPDFYDNNQILDYINVAKSLGYTKVFSSVQLGELNFDNTNENVDQNSFSEVFDFCFHNDLDIVVDVNLDSLKKLGCSTTNLENLAKKNIYCIRLDGGFSDEQFLDIVSNDFNIKIEENASNLKTLSRRMNLMKEKGVSFENLQASFNFFPLEFTGHSYDYVKKCVSTYRAIDQDFQIGAFISSVKSRNDLSNNCGICTIECHRNALIAINYFELKELGINEVIFGEGMVEIEDLETLSKSYQCSCSEVKISFDEYVDIETRQKILETIDCDREDSMNGAIRLTNFRNVFNSDKTRQAETINPLDVVMVNSSSNKRYFGEIWVTVKSFPPRSFISRIGHIDGKYQKLIELIKENQSKISFIEEE